MALRHWQDVQTPKRGDRLQEEVHLTDPLKYVPPTPVRGCKICGALQRQLDKVGDPRSENYDPSKASDLRVEMRRHHPEMGQS